MPTYSICIPWRPAEGRERALNFISRHYVQDANVFLADSDPDKPFNVSQARNNAVAMSDTDVVVLVDADAYIPLGQVKSAVDIAWKMHRLAKPFDCAGYLTESATDWLYETGEAKQDFMNDPTENFVGLSFVIRRDLFDKLSGFDPGFVGYGGDDNAFVAACDNLLGQTIYIPGWGYSLYHPAVRHTSQDNVERVVRYYGTKTWHDYYALRTDV